MSQTKLASDTLKEITNHSPKRLKKDPFWDELLETGGKRYYKHCTKSYYMDTDLSTIKSLQTKSPRKVERTKFCH